ncbi:MAG: hypothetical protein V3S60_00370 [Acidimicrobiia bacterium]
MSAGQRFWVGTWGPATLLFLSSSALAQEDFRNADPDRPIQVEDAYPLKYREWELELGTRPELRDGAPNLYSWMAELKTGIYYDLQLGVELETVLRSGGGLDSKFGIEELDLHLLYNFNQETRTLPAVGVRADLFVPTGGELGRDEFGYAVKALATRSFGRLRLHGNLGYRFSNEDGEPAASDPLEAEDVWLGGLAFDFPIGLFSRLVLGDVFVELPADRGETRVTTELGVRFQIRNTWVLDLGLASVVSDWDDGANGAVIVGLSHTFGVRWLVNVPPYPDPTVDR